MLHTIREWLAAVLFALIVVISFRAFIAEAFTVPTPSMEKTLLPGDFIVVSKLNYGPRIPITPIAFPFAHQSLPFTAGAKSYFDWIQLPYLRIPGYSEIKRNDVVVFNYPNEDDHPVDQRTHFIKRCIALPGDLLEIKKGRVLINKHISDEPENLQFNYHIKTKKIELNEQFLDSNEINEGGKISKNGDYSFSLTRNKANAIRKMTGINLVELFCEKERQFSDYIFPNDEHVKWNADWFGPLLIPQKGDTIKISIANLSTYRRIIEIYEHNTLEVRNDSVYINNAYITHYRIKMNYYFMMGDNRHNSADSRFWGFVPENHIVGKATYILFSINKSNRGGSRWKRWFSKIE